ncbi:MAG: glycosyltransferase, partial [Proteobacteria bacterium]|nr:glycosyltransferase [Pseudomonadota bacterium]
MFNRPAHTRRTLEALKQNPESVDTELYIFSDGPRNAGEAKTVSGLRADLREVSGFKKVVITERPANLGLARSIIAGVTEVVNA